MNFLKRLGKLKWVFKPDINKINERLGLIYSFSTKLLILVSIVALIILLAQAIFVPQTFTINELNIPSSFAGKGYSSNVIGNRLSDNLSKIVNEGHESLRIIEEKIFDEDVDISYQSSSDLSTIDIQVGLFNISITEIIQFLRKKLGYKNLVLEGDLTEEDNTLTLSLRMKSNGVVIRNMRFSQILDGSPNARYNAIDELINKTSEFIIFNNDPVILLAYKDYVDPNGNHDSTFLKIIYDDYYSDKIKQWVYVLWGHTLFKKADNFQFEDTKISDSLYVQSLLKYNKAIEFDPVFIRSIGWNISSYYFSNQLYNEAAKVYQEILIYDSKNKRAVYFLAECLFNLGGEHIDKAIYYYNKVVKYDPNERGIDALLKLGIIYNRKGEVKLAEDYYLKVLNNRYTDEYNKFTALKELAKLYIKQEKYNDVVEILKEAVLFSPDMEVYKNIAEAYAHLGDEINFTNYLHLAVKYGFDLNDSVLETPAYLKYNDSELLNYIIDNLPERVEEEHDLLEEFGL